MASFKAFKNKTVLGSPFITEQHLLNLGFIKTVGGFFISPKYNVVIYRPYWNIDAYKLDKPGLTISMTETFELEAILKDSEYPQNNSTPQ